jgi:hypothetical protein
MEESLGLLKLLYSYVNMKKYKYEKKYKYVCTCNWNKMWTFVDEYFVLPVMMEGGGGGGGGVLACPHFRT